MSIMGHFKILPTPCHDGSFLNSDSTVSCSSLSMMGNFLILTLRCHVYITEYDGSFLNSDSAVSCLSLCMMGNFKILIIAEWVGSL